MASHPVSPAGNSARTRQRFARALTLAAVALIHAPAQGATYTYTGNLGGIIGHNFNSAGNWTPAGGPPGTGASDLATIAKDDVIVLTVNTGTIALLNIDGDADLNNGGAIVYTGDKQLNVTAGANGFTEVINNSVLVVQPGPGYTFGTDTLSLRLGGELRMAGGAAGAAFVLRGSFTSYISGYGIIGLTASSGTGIDMAGTIHPEHGDLNIICSVGAKLDLDGNSAGADLGGILDVTADGGLTLHGALNDPFSGQLTVGNNNRVDWSHTVPFDGTLNFVSGLSNVVSAPSMTFQSGADVQVQGSDGEIEASTAFNSGSTVLLLNAADDLKLIGDSTIASGVSFTGAGALRLAGGGIVTLLDNANVGVRLFNTGAGEVRIGSSPGNATVAGYEQSASSDLRIELGGLVPGNLYDQLAVTGNATLGGELKVSLINGFTLDKAQSFEIIDVAGTRTGTFIGLAEGAKVGAFSGKDLFISYAGGDGNDVLLFTKGFTADFDSDNDVDGRDFLAWQRNRGLAVGATLSQGDADNDKDVDANDFAAWRTQFGGVQSTAVSTPIPEPTTALLLLLAACAPFARAHSHR